MKNKILREIIPLTHSDCFTMFHRTKSDFDFPLHRHEEFELNFIQNARGARRVVGDSFHEIDNLELVFLGPQLQHGWFSHNCRSREIREITIQFHRDLFNEKFLHRNQMGFIRTMFERSALGISFSGETAERMMPRICGLTQKHGFDSVLELMSILHELSTSRNFNILSDVSFNDPGMLSYNSRRIEAVMRYLNANFDKTVTLPEAAKIASMTEIAFSRFFKMRTGKTFVETLTEIRLGHASRMLIETTHGISEVAYKCGFNNISNFSRVFKKKKECTPNEFRREYNASGIRAFV